MSVVSPLVKRWLSAWSLEISWTSTLGDPTFYVYRDGVLVATTKQTAISFTLTSGERIAVEVFDDPDDEPELIFPGRATIQWLGLTAAASYLVEEYVGAAWTQRALLLASGRPYYQWTSRYLEDETTHQFRVTAIGADGNAGTPVAFSIPVVRNPDAPEPTWAFDTDTHELTVTP